MSIDPANGARGKSRRVVAGLVVAIALLMAFSAGFLVGARRAVRNFLAFQESETQANLNFTIEELVWLRTGKSDKAFFLMESLLDNAIGSLRQGREWGELSADLRRSYLVAKSYRRAFPFAASSPEASSVLAGLPDEPIDPAYSSPAARYLRSLSTTAPETP